MNIFFTESRESLDFRREADDILLEFKKEEIKYEATLQTLNVYIENTMDITAKKEDMLYEKALDIYLEQTESVFQKFKKWIVNIINAIIGKKQEIDNSDIAPNTEIETTVDIPEAEKVVKKKLSLLKGLKNIAIPVAAVGTGLAAGKMAYDKGKKSRDNEVGDLQKDLSKSESNANTYKNIAMNQLKSEELKLIDSAELNDEDKKNLQKAIDKHVRASEVFDISKSFEKEAKDIRDYMNEIKLGDGNAVARRVANAQMKVAKEALTIIESCLSKLNADLNKYKSNTSENDVDVDNARKLKDKVQKVGDNAIGHEGESEKNVNKRSKNIQKVRGESAYNIDDILNDEYVIESYDDERNIDSLISLVNEL